jgi:hypothetical protein
MLRFRGAGRIHSGLGFDLDQLAKHAIAGDAGEVLLLLVV